MNCEQALATPYWPKPEAKRWDSQNGNENRYQPPHKWLLHEWSARLGYIEQETYPILERLSGIAPLQRLTYVSTIYRKHLNERRGF
jgi:hypothetical protein